MATHRTPPSFEPLSRPSPQPLHSLVASAELLTSRLLTRAGSGSKSGSASTALQHDAWEMYDLVGEHRFLASTLANRMSQARFYVGLLNDDSTEPPDPVEDESISAILSALGGSPLGFSQIVQRTGVNLFVTGDCLLVGIPRWLLPASLLPVPSFVNPLESVPVDTGSGSLSIEDMDWRLLSSDEVSYGVSGSVVLHLGPSKEDQVACSVEEVFLIRVWRPHPRRWWQADSPTLSSLPVLRELVGLTMHISAQVDSRLAGAGMLIVPQSAQRALNIAAGMDADAPSDLFTEALLEAMLTPINDRASASALVPLVVTVPDEAAALFKSRSFATPLDAEARSLRDEAIRRLALGLDAPPELLLGVSGMNHWGAWLVREDVVTTHIEPPLALFADALTTQYLWPVLMDQGMTEEQAHQYVVWYDVSHMVMRPNRAKDALDLHARGAISSRSLRDATGFNESDAPFDEEEMLDPSVVIALELGMRNPDLYNSPGIAMVETQIRALLEGTPPPEPPAPPAAAPAPPDPVPSPEEGVPDTADQGPDAQEGVG